MAQNPYQMDPFLAQGFSNLTKALIGDPETDYQVSRTNRINTLLPYEQAQLQAAAAADNSLAGQRDAETADILKLAADLQLLSENPLLANAATAPFNLPLDETTGLPQQIDPEAASALLRYSLSGGDPDDRVDAMSTIGEARALNAARRAILTGDDDAIFRGSRLLDPTGANPNQDPAYAKMQLDNLFKIANMESQDDLAGEKNEDNLRFGKGGQGDRDTEANNKGLKDVAQIKADAEKEWQEAVQELKNKSALEIAKIEDETKRYDIDQSQKRLKDENVFKQYMTINGEMIVSPELAKILNIKPDSVTNKYTLSMGNTEDMIEVEIENPGGTPTKVNIAPQNIEKLKPVTKNGKLVIPDGHKFNTLDPKNTKGRIDLIDQEINGAVESGLFAEVPSAVMRKIQSNFTTAAENRDVEDVLRLMRRQLSETYKGETAVTITEGFNFDVPAYIINFLVQPNANLDPNIITNTYGFSLDQANKIIRFVRAQ